MPTQDIDDYTTLVSVSLTTPGAVKILDPSGNEIDPRQIRALTTSDAITPYGSETEKLLQRAATFELLVALRLAGVEIDPRSIRTLTSADTITTYGSQGAPIQQKATSFESLVQLMFGGAEIDPRDVSDRAARLLGVVNSITNPITATENPATSVGTLADVTPGGSTVQLTAASTPCKAVLVRALAGNSGKARVGDSNTGASRGAELSAGDATVLSVNNVNLVYAYATGTDKVSAIYVN